MKKTKLAMAVALMLVAGLALAQTAPAADKSAAPAPRMPCAMQGMPGMMGGPGMPEMTAEQLEKMDALRTAQLKEMLPLRTDLQVKEIELEALWRADEPDAKKIVAKVKEIGDIREKMEVARINHRFEMRKVLTPEQRKAMKKMGMGPGMMRGKMGRGMRGMRGRMGGCPMGQGQCGGSQPGPMMGGQAGPQGCPNCEMH
jgi:Spy/CpxP family protein refolding chaperone